MEKGRLDKSRRRGKKGGDESHRVNWVLQLFLCSVAIDRHLEEASVAAVKYGEIISECGFLKQLPGCLGLEHIHFKPVLE